VRSRLVGIIWLVVGVIIASVHHYFAHVSTLKPVLSALLAIVLWPLLLVGVNLHIH
jgi:FtsH-binding integral membrane protein